MWALVASRLHTVHKIFPFGSGSDQVMLYGEVAYALKDGRKVTVSFPLPAVKGEGLGLVEALAECLG